MRRSSLAICSAFALAAACALAVSALADEHDAIVIDNAPFVGLNEPEPIVAAVTTVRPITRLGVETASFLPTMKFSEDLLFAAAGKIPELVDSVNALKEEKEPDRLIRLRRLIIDSHYYKNQHSIALSTGLSGIARFPVAESRFAVGSTPRYWDARSLVSLTGSGVIDVTNVFEREVEGSTVLFAPFAPEYAREIGNVHLYNSIAANSLPEDLEDSFENLKNNVLQYSVLQKHLLENIGDVSFGYPIAYKAAEMELVLPDSISNYFDVYWINFAVDFRAIDPRQLAEMVFNVGLPPDSLAFELIPLRYGVTVSQETTGGTPQIEIDVKGASIKLGEFFRKTVAYTYLKPTIYAHGLQQPKFSWVLQQEAVRAGSHRFVAIVGVPKGSESVLLAMSGHMKIKQSWVGDWFDGELVAGTDAVVVPIGF